MREPTNGDRYSEVTALSWTAALSGPWVLVLRGYVAMVVHETTGWVIPWHQVVSIKNPLPPAKEEGRSPRQEVIDLVNLEMDRTDDQADPSFADEDHDGQVRWYVADVARYLSGMEAGDE